MCGEDQCNVHNVTATVPITADHTCSLLTVNTDRADATLAASPRTVSHGNPATIFGPMSVDSFVR